MAIMINHTNNTMITDSTTNTMGATTTTTTTTSSSTASSSSSSSSSTRVTPGGGTPGISSTKATIISNNDITSKLFPYMLSELLLSRGPLAIRYITNGLDEKVPGFKKLSASKQRRVIMNLLEQGDELNFIIFEKIGWGQWKARKIGELCQYDLGVFKQKLVQMNVQNEKLNNELKQATPQDTTATTTTNTSTTSNTQNGGQKHLDNDVFEEDSEDYSDDYSENEHDSMSLGSDSEEMFNNQQRHYSFDQKRRKSSVLSERPSPPTPFYTNTTTTTTTTSSSTSNSNNSSNNTSSSGGNGSAKVVKVIHRRRSSATSSNPMGVVSVNPGDGSISNLNDHGEHAIDDFRELVSQTSAVQAAAAARRGSISHSSKKHISSTSSSHNYTYSHPHSHNHSHSHSHSHSGSGSGSLDEGNSLQNESFIRSTIGKKQKNKHIMMFPPGASINAVTAPPSHHSHYSHDSSNGYDGVAKKEEEGEEGEEGKDLGEEVPEEENTDEEDWASIGAGTLRRASGSEVSFNHHSAMLSTFDEDKKAAMLLMNLKNK